jgi:hypothetical protein
LLYAILIVQLLCSKFRNFLRKYYAVQIFSFIYQILDEAHDAELKGKEKRNEIVVCSLFLLYVSIAIAPHPLII